MSSVPHADALGQSTAAGAWMRSVGSGWPASPLPLGGTQHALLLRAAIQQCWWRCLCSSGQAAWMQDSRLLLLLLLTPQPRSLRQAGGGTQQQQGISAVCRRLLPCCQHSAHALHKQLPQHPPAGLLGCQAQALQALLVALLTGSSPGGRCRGARFSRGAGCSLRHWPAAHNQVAALLQRQNVCGEGVNSAEVGQRVGWSPPERAAPAAGGRDRLVRLS